MNYSTADMSPDDDQDVGDGLDVGADDVIDPDDAYYANEADATTSIDRDMVTVNATPPAPEPQQPVAHVTVVQQEAPKRAKSPMRVYIILLVAACVLLAANLCYLKVSSDQTRAAYEEMSEAAKQDGSDAQDKVDKLNQDLDAANKQLEDTKSSADQRVDALEKTNKDLQDRLDTLQGQLDDLKAKLGEDTSSDSDTSSDTSSDATSADASADTSSADAAAN